MSQPLDVIRCAVSGPDNGAWELPSRMARLETRAENLEARIAGLTPLATTVALLDERQRAMRGEVDRLEAVVDKLSVQIDAWDLRQQKREETNAKERRETWRWIIGTFVILLAALIGGFATVLASGAHP